MLRKSVILLSVLLSICAKSSYAAEHWGKIIDERHDSILAVIKGAPQCLPEAQEQRSMMITDFGAKVYDEIKQTDCKPAFDKAMKKALRTKGGLRIVVPKGKWFVKGPIHLVSNVTLEIKEGARLLFSDDPKDYLPMVKTSWEGNFCFNYSPFIYGYNIENVAIVGKGVIDGNCINSFPLWRSNQKKDQQKLRSQCHNNIPYAERKYGEGHLLRPHLIQLYGCRNITLEGVFITNSPFWCLHLLKSENIVCRNLRYDAKLVNNDGIDPEMSRNILIENIDFNNGDDNVAIKAGRDNDGWKESCPSENIIIRNCRFKGLHGVVIGSEMSSGVRNVFVEDCTYGGYNKRALYMKTNPNRGGFIHDIYFRNCRFGEVEDLFYITSMYAGEGADDNHYTDIHDIHIKDIKATKVNNAAIVLQGTDAKPLKHISFERIDVEECKIGFSSVNAPDVTLTDCNLGGRVNTAPSQASKHDKLFE
ncbi:MAG: glycoside hydrolase family 28 protein [Prevotella sp.]